MKTMLNMQADYTYVLVKMHSADSPKLPHELVVSTS